MRGGVVVDAVGPIVEVVGARVEPVGVVVKGSPGAGIDLVSVDAVLHEQGPNRPVDLDAAGSVGVVLLDRVGDLDDLVIGEVESLGDPLAGTLRAAGVQERRVDAVPVQAHHDRRPDDEPGGVIGPESNGLGDHRADLVVGRSN